MTVVNNAVCESACAYIWLAGAPRFAEASSLIGFHAAYDGMTLQDMGNANAVLGGYLARLGLRYDTIAWMTSASPARMSYLSIESAVKYGILLNGSLPTQAQVDAFAATIGSRQEPPPPVPKRNHISARARTWRRCGTASEGRCGASPAAIRTSWRAASPRCRR